MSQRICSIEDCVKPTRSSAADWCKMHYHRWYRHGDPMVTSVNVSTRTNDTEYQRLFAPGHPVSTPSGKTYVHRVVLYDAIGEGPHACVWCSVDLDWHAPKGAPNKLTVDHLNEKRDDNRLVNLAPACPPCNADRGSEARARRLRSLGWWSNNDTIAGLSTGGRKDRAA